MRELTQAEWHQVAGASEVITHDGRIVGVVEDGERILFISHAVGGEE